MKVKKYTKNKNLAKKINLAKKKKTMRRRYKSKGGSVSTRSERAKENAAIKMQSAARKYTEKKRRDKEKRDKEQWGKIDTAAAKQGKYLGEH